MTADELLELLKPYGVTGLSMKDIADPATWAFTGKYDRPTVVAAVQAALQLPTVVADPLIPIVTDVSVLRSDVDYFAAQMKVTLPSKQAQPSPQPQATP